MTKRVFRGIFYVSMAALLLCLGVVLGVLYGYYDHELQTQLAEKAAYLAPAAEAQGTAYLAAVKNSSDRITLIAADGTVLYDDRAKAADMGSHAQRREFIEARQNGTGKAVRISDTLSEKTCYYAILLSDGTVLRVACTQATVWAMLGRLAWPLVALVALEIALSAFLAARLSRRIMAPINAIDPRAPLLSDGYEELAPLLEKLAGQKQKIAAQIGELQRRQREFAAVTDHMSEGLLMTDAGGGILLQNESSRRFFGAGETPGESVLTLNRSPVFRRVMEEVLGGARSTGILLLQGRTCELTANPVYPEGVSGGPPAGAVLLTVDVTEREARERLRREFTSNVSHELKTPLTALFGASELLAAGLVAPGDVPSFAQDIHEETGRLIALTEDIIRLSRLDEGAVPAEKEAVELYALCNGVLAELRPMAEKKHVECKLEGFSLVFYGIRALLHEMVYNLCENAVKYNRENGTVTVRVQPTADGGTISVQDTGIGIPAGETDRVFERFYRVDKSRSGKVPGTGLGLSIVKHAVQYHGGTVSLQSRLGQGTCVTVHLPPAPLP